MLSAKLSLGKILNYFCTIQNFKTLYFAGNTFSTLGEVLDLLKYASTYVRVIVEIRWRE